MKIIKNIGCIAAVASLMLSSCKGDLMDTFPYTQISSGSMWSNENLADNGVTGIYNILYRGNVAANLYKFDCFGVTSDCRDMDYPILRGTVTAGDGLFSGYWQEHYAGIHRANDAIQNLPNVNMDDAKKGRLLAEAYFFRAFFYFNLNAMFKGVPLYLKQIELDECIEGRESEARVWESVISDLTHCINEPNFPGKHPKGNALYGRATKGAAYALRGKAYMWTKEWAKAEDDFRKVGELGYDLFQGGYKELFKEANEQSDEMIFSLQSTGLSGYGNDFSFRYGSRVTFGSCWNTYLPSTDFVESYECIDGKPFDWNDFIPGYNEMAPDARAVFFLRDTIGAYDSYPASVKAALRGSFKQMETNNADMSKYLPEGNEARIRKVYENRDPRLMASIITPYSEYYGAVGSTGYTYTLRWPYVGYDTAIPFDVKTDTNNRFYYLFRKFVAEGPTEIPNRTYSPIDIPLIRYADVILLLAEALNEQNKTEEAITWVNKVRGRAGIALLNSNSYTQVTGQQNMRERIRNERRWEFNGEGINFFDEMRWGTWKESKFKPGAGLKQIWGTNQYQYGWAGDHVYSFAIPRTELQMNSNLTQNPGWVE